jgi:large subunit ribosomal protein L25
LKSYSISASPREATGKSAARALRREGRIPGVLYGASREKALLLSIDTREMSDLCRKTNIGQQLLNLKLQSDDKYKKKVMVKELQVHPISREFLHVDFHEIAMDQKLWVKIPLETTGTPKGVEVGGILQVVRHELDVYCLPQDIPDSFVIDVTDLEIGDSVHVDQIPLAEGVEIPRDVDFTVLTVVSPMQEEEPEAEPEEGEELEEEGAAEEEEQTEDSEPAS